MLCSHIFEPIVVLVQIDRSPLDNAVGKLSTRLAKLGPVLHLSVDAAAEGEVGIDEGYLELAGILCNRESTFRKCMQVTMLACTS
jgi:hypothetical protein